MTLVQQWLSNKGAYATIQYLQHQHQQQRSTFSLEAEIIDLPEYWKRYMGTPLGGAGPSPPDLFTSVYRGQHVASLPGAKAPIVGNTNYLQQQHQPYEGGESSSTTPSIPRTLHGNAEDLRSYEAAVLARKVPTALKLPSRAKRRGGAGTSTQVPSSTTAQPPMFKLNFPPHLNRLGSAPDSDSDSSAALSSLANAFGRPQQHIVSQQQGDGAGAGGGSEPYMSFVTTNEKPSTDPGWPWATSSRETSISLDEAFKRPRHTNMNEELMPSNPQWTVEDVRIERIGDPGSTGTEIRAQRSAEDDETEVEFQRESFLGSFNKQSFQMPEEEGQSITRCVCGNPREDDLNAGEFIIQCEACDVWQHAWCMGYQSQDQVQDDHYYCEQCRPDLHTELLKKLNGPSRRSSMNSRNVAYENFFREAVSVPSNTNGHSSLYNDAHSRPIARAKRKHTGEATGAAKKQKGPTSATASRQASVAVPAGTPINIAHSIEPSQAPVHDYTNNIHTSQSAPARQSLIQSLSQVNTEEASKEGDMGEDEKMEQDAKTMELAAKSVANDLISPKEDSQLAVISLCNAFAAIFTDKVRYRALLNNRGDSAQNVIDLLHALLDYPQLDASSRSKLLKALLRLSKRTSLYPRCFSLNNIERGEAPITAGHFGEIWKGKFRGQVVCLKVVKVYERSHVEHLLKAFWREAVLWAHISHASLLPFYGIFHLEDMHGRICLVSPWMDNGNIIDYLKARPEAVRLLLISDIIEGISYLHDENIVHGDLKGVNILVTDTGKACLADFGLSSVMDTDILRWTSVQSTSFSGGTLRWQAPELMMPDETKDVRLSSASDIFAFSCVCYEILTGQPPFYEHNYDATVMFKVLGGERPSRPEYDSQLCRDWGLSESMWTLMNHCWMKNPNDRPDAKEVLKRLPLGDIIDSRPEHDWDSLCSSRFRSEMHRETKHLTTEHLRKMLSETENKLVMPPHSDKLETPSTSASWPGPPGRRESNVENTFNASGPGHFDSVGDMVIETLLPTLCYDPIQSKHSHHCK